MKVKPFLILYFNSIRTDLRFISSAFLVCLQSFYYEHTFLFQVDQVPYNINEENWFSNGISMLQLLYFFLNIIQNKILLLFLFFHRWFLLPQKCQATCRCFFFFLEFIPITTVSIDSTVLSYTSQITCLVYVFSCFLLILSQRHSFTALWLFPKDSSAGEGINEQ